MNSKHQTKYRASCWGQGIEAIIATNNGTASAYPLYDTHGNMVATLSKNSAGTSWSVGDERSYDVWGGVRSGAVTGGPKGRYVANLGHVQDDESGLIYMRARYYEPDTGRFISEDPARDGGHWLTYCGSNPTNLVDESGNSYSPMQSFVKALLQLIIAMATSTAARIFATTIALTCVSAVFTMVCLALTPLASVLGLAGGAFGVQIGGYILSDGLKNLIGLGKDIINKEGAWGEKTKWGRRGGLLVEVLGFYNAMAATYEMIIAAMNLFGAENL